MFWLHLHKLSRTVADKDNDSGWQSFLHQNSLCFDAKKLRLHRYYCLEPLLDKNFPKPPNYWIFKTQKCSCYFSYFIGFIAQNWRKTKRISVLWSVKIPESRPLKPAYLRLSDLQNTVEAFHWLNGELIVPDRNPNKKPSDEKAIGKGILATNQQYFCLHVKSKFLKKFPSLATRDFVAKMNFAPR